jgi:hypothetical protein
VGDTSPVDSYLGGASPNRALDITGNIGEWVSDWFGSDYYSISPPCLNPPGPSSGTYKMVRGGSRFYNVQFIRTTRRGNQSQPTGSSSWISSGVQGRWMNEKALSWLQGAISSSKCRAPRIVSKARAGLVGPQVGPMEQRCKRKFVVCSVQSGFGRAMSPRS